ncbi:MAG: hypothetical protein ACI9JN_002109 [Bacteroidia bacterium]|jgi:hypothetical protein
MKTFITMILGLLTLNNYTMGQNETKVKAFQSKKEISINTSAAKLWQIIGPGFAEYYKWATIVDFSTGKGDAEINGAPHDERVCTVNGQGDNKVTEKLFKYSDSDMNLAYEATEGMHEMMNKATNEMTIVRLSDTTSKIVVNIEWLVNGPIPDEMKQMMEGNLKITVDTFLNDIKVFAETGLVSQTKQERLDELAN